MEGKEKTKKGTNTNEQRKEGIRWGEGRDEGKKKEKVSSLHTLCIYYMAGTTVGDFLYITYFNPKLTPARKGFFLSLRWHYI